MQVRADPLHLPLPKSPLTPACWRTPCRGSDPHRLLREADRVLIDDGWMILTGFNPVSLMGLRKLVPVLRKGTPYNSRMFTLMRQLDGWRCSTLKCCTMDVTVLPVAPWRQIVEHPSAGAGLFAIDCRPQRTIPLTLNPMKSGKAKTQLRPAVGATRQWRKGQN